MSECDEIADGFPLIDINKPISMDEARAMVRVHLADEIETVIDNVTQRYCHRLNAHHRRIQAQLAAQQRSWPPKALALALVLALAPGPAHAAAAGRVGDAYIGCVVSKAAIALRTHQHDSPEDKQTIAFTATDKPCAHLWPSKLPNGVLIDLGAETNDLVAHLTGVASDVENEPEAH